eukprot:TRINITY_DN100_c2_g1_i2.p2 TRINITY_DN100_c2_g1~~TRINITY_DN100_c2_g1_i2.p2  ORF type:complete len:192 (+),score=6.79 TRINITY_DN100_c2_g1_i2:113-688(+)
MGYLIFYDEQLAFSQYLKNKAFQQYLRTLNYYALRIKLNFCYQFFMDSVMEIFENYIYLCRHKSKKRKLAKINRNQWKRSMEINIHFKIDIQENKDPSKLTQNIKKMKGLNKVNLCQFQVYDFQFLQKRQNIILQKIHVAATSEQKFLGKKQGEEFQFFMFFIQLLQFMEYRFQSVNKRYGNSRKDYLICK